MRRAALLLTMLLALAAPAQAMTALFYQPQTRDLSQPAENWPRLFATTRQLGFDTLVVQWTRYGNGLATPAQQDWLTARLIEARAAGLQLVVGLAADPDFFARQQAPVQELGSYLATLRRNDLQAARSWLQRLGPDAIAGWYLPSELDDARWRDPAARKLLLDGLGQHVGELRKLLPRPVYISSFFVGNMAPAQYRGLVAEVAARGTHVWVHDGRGVGKLNAAERALYLKAVGDCPNPAAAGVVYELFRQTAPDEAFKAERLPLATARPLLQQRAPCGGDSVFFSLRYLPQAGERIDE